MDKPRRVATLATGIPLTLMGIVILVVGLLGKKTFTEAEGLTAVDISLQVLIGLVAVAFLSSVVPAVRSNKEIAWGIRLGSGIGLVVWLIMFIALTVYFEQ